MSMSGIDVEVTGLPQVATVARDITSVDPKMVLERIYPKQVFAPDTKILSLGLPGDPKGCYNMLHHADDQKLQDDDLLVFARSHPGLAKQHPDHFEHVNAILTNMDAFPLAEANDKVSLLEQIALAQNGLFVCDWNSSMAFQAIVTGVPTALVPPEQEPEVWRRSAPALVGKYAAEFPTKQTLSNLELRPLVVPIDPVEAIAGEVKRLAGAT